MCKRLLPLTGALWEISILSKACGHRACVCVRGEEGEVCTITKPLKMYGIGLCKPSVSKISGWIS